MGPGRRGQSASALAAFEQAVSWRMRVAENQLGPKNSQPPLNDARFELASTTAESSRTNEKQAARAVALLCELCQADPANATGYLEKCKTLPEWTPLRSRPDFQEIARGTSKR